MDSYKFVNGGHLAPGKAGPGDEVVVEIEPGTVQAMYERAKLTGRVEYKHRDDYNSEFYPGSTDKFEVKRINGAHTDSMKVKPYSELHVHSSGQVTIFVTPFKYTVGLHEDGYEDFGLPAHDHLDW